MMEPYNNKYYCYRRYLIFILLLIFCRPLFYGYADEVVERGGKEQKHVDAGVIRLSLDEACRLALESDFDIQIAKYDAMIARTNLGEALSIYDALLTGSIGYRDNQSKQTSILMGTKTVDYNYNLGISKKLPSGTVVNIDLSNNRHWTDSSSVSSALTHEAKASIVVSQPLGRNFFGVQDKGRIDITKIGIENTGYLSLDRIEARLAAVEKIYWELVLEFEQVKIEEGMVAQAKHLYELHQEKLKHGLIEMPEAIASEANYMKRKDELVLLKNRLNSTANILKLYLNIDESKKIETTDNLRIIPFFDNLPQILKVAFSHRRDYLYARNVINQNRIVLAMKKNSAWPEINLKASFEKNGIGDHFKQAWVNISDEDNPDFYVGVSFQFPLGNNKAKSQIEAARLKVAKAILNMKYIERTIAITVADQYRTCNIYRRLAVNSEKIAELYARKLKEEENRFSQGRSNTDTLIRFQEELLQARLSAAEAKYRYHVAMVDLELEQGILLEKYHFSGLVPFKKGGDK